MIWSGSLFSKTIVIGSGSISGGPSASLRGRETDDLKWSGSDHDLDHYLAGKDRIVAHIFENGKG